MNKSRPKLGRGLDALLGEDALEHINTLQENNTHNHLQANEIHPAAKHHPHDVAMLAIEDVHPGPWQPRRQFDEKALDELANSIASKGLLQPILVCPHEKSYAIIAGERRWRAAQRANITHIPALVHSHKDVDAHLLALIENIQREDLSILEVAEAMENLHARDMSHQSIASALGISRSSVTNTMRLLELPDRAKTMLRDGIIDMGHARAVLSLDAHQRLEAVTTIAVKRMTVRQAEQFIKKCKNPGQKHTTQPISYDPNITSLIERCQDELSTKVEIRQKSAASGELRIAYGSLEQLNSLLEKLTPRALQDK